MADITPSDALEVVREYASVDDSLPDLAEAIAVLTNLVERAGTPVVDEAMAQKFWDGYEQYFVDLSADELFDGKDRKIEAAMYALTAALGADHE